MPGVNRYGNWWRGGLFLLIAAFVVAADQITKLWISVSFAPRGIVPEVGCLSITHVQNTGSAFGLFANQSVLLSIVAFAGIVVILLFYRYLSSIRYFRHAGLGADFWWCCGQSDRPH